MLNYIGVRCPVCNKKFTQADDIVVCPVCGAPHHRDCYSQKSACAFVDDHLNGVEWNAPAEPHCREQGPGAGPEPVACPFCQAPNSGDAVFCQACGSRISNAPPPHFSEAGQGSWGFSGVMRELDPVSLMYGGLSPDDTISGESVRDLALYVGENSAYYLPRFKSMDETGRTLSFNFSALIFGFLYYFHRKMYLIGTILFALSIIGSVPSFLQAREILPQIMYSFGLGPDLPVNTVAAEHYQSLVNITGSINFMIRLIISFCANRFYYAKALADVKKIRENGDGAHDEIAYSRALTHKGGVSRAAVFAVIGTYMAGYFITAVFLYYQYVGMGGAFIK